MKLFAFVLAMLFGLQSPGAAPTQPAKSTIEGVVVRADSNEPIAGAQVFLLAGNGPGAVRPFANAGPHPATTDKDGKFVMNDVEAGQYRLAAARNGYARQEYGQRAIGRVGIVLNVLAGQTIK